MAWLRQSFSNGQRLLTRIDLVTVANLCQFSHVGPLGPSFVMIIMIVHHEAVELLVRHGLYEDGNTSTAECSVINLRIMIVMVQIGYVFVAANAPASVLFDEQPGNHGSDDGDRSSELAA
jgi:hypothetical protein